MPRYFKHHGDGYDLDRELPFCDVDGVGRVVLGSGHCWVMICPTCKSEQLRHPIHPARIQLLCHGPMVPLTFELFEQIQPTMRARGIRFTTVEYRRQKRLEREAAEPWDWKFGTTTEADYPKGYCKEDTRELQPADHD